MILHRVVIALCLTALPASIAAQVPTERQRVILLAIDADADGAISRTELRAWLRHALLTRARNAGLTADPSSEEFDRTVSDQADQTMKDATADSDDNISLAELDAMEASELLAPLRGTVGSLLPPPPRTATAGDTWGQRLERWLDIRQSFANEQDVGKPAKFSLVNHHKSDETVESGKARRLFTVKASVILSGFVEWEPIDWLLVRPTVGYEVSTESSTPSKDQILHRAGAVFVARQAAKRAEPGIGGRVPGPPIVSSHRLLVTFDHRTDRGYDADVRGGTVRYTLNALRLGIGRYLGGGAPVDFRWRPYAGVTWATVHDAGGVEAYQELSDFTHWYLQLTGELKVGESVQLTPETTFVRGERPDGAGGKAHEHVSLSVRWILSGSPANERASLSLAGGLGRESPDMKKEKKVELALGFKF